MFDWLKKKNAPKKQDAEPSEKDSGYSRRQFLRGSFVRDALDHAVDKLDASQAPPTRAPGHKPVDLLAVLSQLDPHSSERQLPPGVDEFNPRRRGTIPVIRPPGAVAEADFLHLCTLCDACLEACP